MTKENPSNKDPITGEPGTHLVGVGAGTAAGATAGAAAGAIAGPAGVVIGAVAGGIAGAVSGKAIAEEVNPTVELDQWKKDYSSRPYVKAGESFDTYSGAYKSGIDGYNQYGRGGQSFDDVEDDLRSNYESGSRGQTLSWDRARQAARDAWMKIEDRIPGDSNRNGH